MGDTMTMEKNAQGVWEIKLPEADPTARLEAPGAGILGGITKTSIMGLEVGKIAIGTFGGVFASEIVDGFLAAQNTMIKGAAKLATAGVVGTWGKRWLGSEVAMAIAFVLGVFGLSQVLPIDKYAAQLAGTVKGILPGTIKVTGMPNPGRDVLNQAEGVAGNYYSSISRRAG